MADWKQLGLSRERMEKFGKPHLGQCFYKGKKNRLEQGATCFLCGRPATNSHHIVPKGMGCGSAEVEVGGRVLKSSLMAVCGSGNASGCHRDMHSGKVKVRWVWFSAFFREMWEDGKLAEPFSPELYKYGYWEITSNGKTFEYGSKEVRYGR